MSQPQPNSECDHLSVNGLEHVFVDVVVEEIPPGTPAGREGIPEAPPEVCEGIPEAIPEGIPVEQAARLLGTSTRAVIKRLQKGTLKGHKVASKYGDKWIVDPEGIPAENQEIPEGTPKTSEGFPVQNQGVPVEIVQDLLRKVEALTYRNGYLEAQLAEKEVQIKLLTCDPPVAAEHTPPKPWWQRLFAATGGGA